MLVKILTIRIHLSLRVDILEEASVVPPARRGLNEDFIGLDLFDQFLCSLSKHSGSVCCAYKVDILTIKPLSQMNQSSIEAVVTKRIKFIVSQ